LFLTIKLCRFGHAKILDLFSRIETAPKS
jgi:hypothetical protein